MTNFNTLTVESPDIQLPTAPTFQITLLTKLQISDLYALKVVIAMKKWKNIRDISRIGTVI